MINDEVEDFTKIGFVDKLRVLVCKAYGTHMMICMYEGIEGTRHECLVCGVRLDVIYEYNHYDHIR